MVLQAKAAKRRRRSWLESSVLIRLTRGIALMRTSRHSMHTMHNHWQSSLPLTPPPHPYTFTLLFIVIWHLTFHVDLAALFCAWLVSFFSLCVTSGLLIQVSPIWRASTPPPLHYLWLMPQGAAPSNLFRNAFKAWSTEIINFHAQLALSSSTAAMVLTQLLSTRWYHKCSIKVPL